MQNCSFSGGGGGDDVDNNIIVSEIEALSDEDRVLDYGSLGNFSLSGFEMVFTIMII